MRGMQLISQCERLKIHLYFTIMKLSTLSVLWDTPDYGDRLAGIHLVLVTNATKVKMCDTKNA
jgi:hypothetical protein